MEVGCKGVFITRTCKHDETGKEIATLEKTYVFIVVQISVLAVLGSCRNIDHGVDHLNIPVIGQ